MAGSRLGNHQVRPMLGGDDVADLVTGDPVPRDWVEAGNLALRFPYISASPAQSPCHRR